MLKIYYLNVRHAVAQIRIRKQNNPWKIVVGSAASRLPWRSAPLHFSIDSRVAGGPHRKTEDRRRAQPNTTGRSVASLSSTAPAFCRFETHKTGRVSFFLDPAKSLEALNRYRAVAVGVSDS